MERIYDSYCLDVSRIPSLCEKCFAVKPTDSQLVNFEIDICRCRKIDKLKKLYKDSLDYNEHPNDGSESD